MFGNRNAVQMPAGSTAAAGGGTLEYAGFWARVAALLVDWAILTVFSIVIMVALSMGLGATGAVIGNVIVLLAQFLYWPIMESSARQATFGKSLLGIEVTDADGGRTTFVRSLLRNLAKIISALPLGIGYLLAGLTARKQALHDMMTGCLVVRSGPSGFLKAAVAAVGGLALAAFGSYYFLFNYYIPQQMERAMKAGGGDFQREMEKALKGQGTGRDMAREMERAMAAAQKEQQKQMEKARREAAKASTPARPAPGPVQAASQPSAPPAPAAQSKVPVAAAVQIAAPAPMIVASRQPVAAAPVPAAAGRPAMASAANAPAVTPMAAPAPKAEAGREPMAMAAPPAPDKPQARVARKERAAMRAESAPAAPARTPKYNDVMSAVMLGDAAGAAEILELGAWVDRRDSKGGTALMVAAMRGDVMLTELLLERGANPNHSALGGSVLAHAERGGNARVVELLKKAGAR
jgi:uncharacterized RDD family membrane protein YckC